MKSRDISRVRDIRNEEWKHSKVMYNRDKRHRITQDWNTGICTGLERDKRYTRITIL